VVLEQDLTQVQHRDIGMLAKTPLYRGWDGESQDPPHGAGKGIGPAIRCEAPNMASSTL